MQLLIYSLLFLVAVVRLSRASFYDNPSLELPPAGGTPLDELEKKWGTDVSNPIWDLVSKSFNFYSVEQ